MLSYLIRRLLLIPITLFCIALVNFVIINLAPGDPVSVTEISPEGGASRKEGRSSAFGSDERYLQFREFYGLTLPILFNIWPSLTQNYVDQTLHDLAHKQAEIDVKSYDQLRILFGDQSRFIMLKLLHVIEDPSQEMVIRRMASHFFARGGTRQGFLGGNLTADQKAYNKKVAKDNLLLRSLTIRAEDKPEVIQKKIEAIRKWAEENKNYYQFEPQGWEKFRIFFTDTRFYRYFSRVLTLNFGTMRNDENKTVIYEVVRRFKYSLTLSILPMIITFFLCQFFGFLMAYKHNQFPDYGLNFLFLVLYAIPIFVVAPFLIEKVALHRTFPFTDIPIPISGFASPERIYKNLNSFQRLIDVLQHIMLPVIAIMYGTLAAQARLARTAVLEVLRQDFVRTAWAKGVPPSTILVKDVGRNAAITIVTSLAGSLGIILGGSLIVETLFGIDGFGKFFYDAVVNRDYNVIMFSALAGSFLALCGYLVADIAYTLLDPRLTLE